jgi:kumamolisin
MRASATVFPAAAAKWLTIEFDVLHVLARQREGCRGKAVQHVQGIRSRSVLRSFFVFVWAGLVAPAAEAAPRPHDLTALPGHVLPALSRAERIASPADADSLPVTVTLTLARDDQAGFDRYLRDVYDPASPAHRRFLSAREITERFGPSRWAYASARRYLRERGFELVAGSSNRLTLTMRGTRTEVAQAFGVHVADYRLDGQTFYANDADPLLPKTLARHVASIAGLANLATPRPNVKAIRVSLFKVACILELSSVVAFENYFGGVALSDDAIRQYFKSCVNGHAAAVGYGVIYDSADPPPPTWLGVDGTGQTIGITAFDSYLTSDVADYISLLGLPAAKIDDVTQVHVNGGAALGADQAEVLLDIADVLSIAPGARIVVYDAPFSGAGSFQALFNAMIDDGVHIITNSWAYCEDQTTLADVQSIDAILENAAAAGISVFTASGDTGSTCLNGSPNTIAVPAGSPNVTAVGGSSLTLGPGLTYGSETWWDGTNDDPPTGQGGFGVSRFFARPSYQDGLVTSANRSIPDVVANADPAKGVMICQASAGGCPTGQLFGGTSSSAPMWAAFAALLNQGGGVQYGAFNPLLYQHAGTDGFHDAASMGSDFAHVGLGSPNLPRLHQLLSGQATVGANAALSNVTPFGPNFTPPQADAVPGSIPADGVAEGYVVVRLLDDNGNVVPGKTVTLTANPPGNVAITPPSVISSVDNGGAVFTVTNLAAETVTFTATDTTDGVQLAQTADVTFSVPVATAAGIAASPNVVTADGVATTSITVTLRDALDRPTPGKEVSLSQGAGHSLVTAPNPSVTDVNGQIVFTATNTTNEVVTYTAVDVTDGDLPIPGSAEVEFTDGTGTSCGDTIVPPVGENGFLVMPFLSGFSAGNLVFGGINFGGCSGATSPGFFGGDVWISNFLNGDLFRLGATGGAVSSTNRLATHGPTLSTPTFGSDGRLYASRVATTGDFRTGAILELDPDTGAVVRTVASDLYCPTAPVVDPLSGDLFYASQCFNTGADDPRLYRVRNPASATPTVETYATLPSTPNGVPVFAPNGTIYVSTAYTSAAPPVVRVSGTDGPVPPSVTPVAGANAIFWVNVGAVGPDGEAQSLVTLESDGLKLVDVTVDPPTETRIAQNLGGGVVGPDGCLYASISTGVVRVSDDDGGCSFAPAGAGPSLTLTPASIAPDPAQGDAQTFTATFNDADVPAGTRVSFQVTGANPQLQLARTDASRQATFTYTGVVEGRDSILATATIEGEVIVSNRARITWTAGRHVTALTLNQSPTLGAPDAATNVVAALTDVSNDPSTPIAGQSITFAIDEVECAGTTDADGLATCPLTPALVGAATLQATFAGTAALTPAVDSIGFNVVCPSDLDGVACYLAGFQAVLDAAAAEDVKRPVRRGLLKKAKKLAKLVDKARTDDRRGEKARAKLPKKLDKLVTKVDKLPEKKISAALKAELSSLATGARSRVPAP